MATEREPSHLLRDLLIMAVLLGGAFFAYYRHVKTQEQVRALSLTARDQLSRDTPRDLLAAEKTLTGVLALDSSDQYATAALAEIDVLLWGEHGVQDRKAAAHQWVAKADALDAHLDERYGAHALLAVYDGKPQEAVDYIVGVNKQGAQVAARMHDALGRALRALGKLPEARKEFKAAVDGSWRNPRFACDLGQSYLDAGDLVNAYEFFRKAVDANPSHPRALAGRSQAAIAAGLKIKEATDSIAQVLSMPGGELTPHLEAQALTARAALRWFEHNPAAAQKDLDAALAAWPEYAAAHRQKGVALAAAKSPGPARAEFDRSIALDPWVPGTYFDAARSLTEAGDAGALAFLDDHHYGKALPKDDKYYLTFGDLLRKKGELDAALGMYDKAVAANAFNGQAYFAKGQVYEAKKEFDKAGAEYEKAIKVQDHFPEVYEQIAMIFVTHAKYEDALSNITTALDQYRAAQAPREKLNGLIDGFSKKLPKKLQKQFVEEARARIR